MTYWHVETDYVALALLIIMVIKNRQLTSDKSRRHQTFYWVLVISIFSTIVDIVSSIAMNSSSSWWFYEIVMVLYVLTMPINAVFWMGYSAVLVADEKDYNQVKKLVHVALIPYYVYGIMALSNPFTEVFFHLTKDMVYSRGVLFIPGGFGFIILYTLAGIVILIRGRKKFDNPANAWMLAAVFAFTLAAIGIQVLNPGWLIAGASYALLYVYCDMTVEEERRNVLYKTIERQNAALKESVEKANAASLAKSNFLANMSHDIRTPLNAITGITNMAIANIDDKNEKEGREGMALGQYIAGMGFSNVGLGIDHSMAHTLSAHYDTPHGVACASLLPIVMEFNRDYTGEKYREIARAMGVEGVDAMSQEQYRDAAINAVKKLSADVCINPKNDRIKAEDLDQLASDALKDACYPGNPREATKEQVIAMFRQLM